MENSPSCPECISISFLCVPIFPCWWLYPPEAIPAAFLSPLSSQYLFDVKKAEDKVLVSLQQEDRRKYKKEGKGDNITIGFEIFKVGRVCSVCSTLALRFWQLEPGLSRGLAQTSCGHCTQAMGAQLNLVQLQLYLDIFHLFEINFFAPFKRISSAFLIPKVSREKQNYINA